MSRLAQAQIALIRKHASAPDWLDLGTILPDGSLQVDRLTVAFPPGTFYVLEYLRARDPLVTTGAGGTDGHVHDVPRPQIFDPLVAGDRVLVAYVNEGVDPVVLGRVRRLVDA